MPKLTAAQRRNFEAQSKLIKAFFESNDLPECIQMNNALLIEIFNSKNEFRPEWIPMANMILFNTQVTELLVSLYAIDHPL